MTHILQRQKFWYNFVGRDIDTNVWNINHQTGTGTVLYVDESDEGLEITTGAVSNGETEITFNDRRQFDFANYAIIAILKRVDASTATFCGLAESGRAGGNNFSCFEHDTDDTNYGIRTKDATTASSQFGSTAIDTLFHNHRMLGTSTSAEYFLDGASQFTKTTNLSTGKMQPFFEVLTRDSTANSGRIKYFEVYNR